MSLRRLLILALLGVAFAFLASVLSVPAYFLGAGLSSEGVLSNLHIGVYLSLSLFHRVCLLGIALGLVVLFSSRLSGNALRAIILTVAAALIGGIEGYWSTVNTIHFPVVRGVIRFGATWFLLGLVLALGFAAASGHPPGPRMSETSGQ